MRWRLIEEAHEWEEMVHRFPEANFLQAWAWGEAQGALGKQVLRLASEDGEMLAQGVVERARRGSYLAVAGGPLLDWQDEERLAAILSELGARAQTLGCRFVRLRPQYEAASLAPARRRRLGLVPAPMHLTADLTLELDLTLNETELLAQMRKQHRQAIRKAHQLGIETALSQDPSEVKRFYQLQLEVARRHHFVPFSERFLEVQFNAFLAADQVALVQASYQGQLLAMAFVIFYHGEAVYHYGISTAANAKLPGSYACQWRVIQEARARGCQRYNLWGIAPHDAPQHRFAGTSLFKRGFGGREVQYLPAHDLPLSRQYWLTWLFESARRRWRRL